MARCPILSKGRDNSLCVDLGVIVECAEAHHHCCRSSQGAYVRSSSSSRVLRRERSSGNSAVQDEVRGLIEGVHLDLAMGHQPVRLGKVSRYRRHHHPRPTQVDSALNDRGAKSEATRDR